MPYPPHRPKPRGVRSRIVRAGAVCGLALVPVAFAGCTHDAGPGSQIAAVFYGAETHTAPVVRGTDGTMVASTRITDADGKSISPGYLTVTAGTVAETASDTGGGQSLVFYGPSKIPSIPSSFADGNDWALPLTWDGIRPNANRVSASLTSEGIPGLYGDDYYVVKQTWLLVSQGSATPSRDPSHHPLANIFAHDTPSPIAPSPVAPTVLDARQSLSIAVTPALTYSWDTNGDGNYGDAPTGGWSSATAPTDGTAYVPLDAATAAFPLPLTVGVKVTNSAGLSDTATLRLPVSNHGAGGMSVALRNGTVDITPLIGTLPDGNVDQFGVTYACVGTANYATGEGADTFVTTNGIEFEPGGRFLSSQSTLAWTGTRRIRVSFFQDDPTRDVVRGTCNNPAPLAVIQSTHTELVTVTNGVVTVASATGAGAHEMAAAPAPKGYSGKARVRLNSGAILAVGKTDGTSMSGVINQGKYSLTAPTRTGRTARPPALALFAKGDFASSSNAELGFSETNATTPLTGTSTVLLRGAKGALGCMSVVRTDTTTTWSFLGGTRAASKLRMTLTGGPTLNSTINQAAAPQAVRAKAKGAKGRKAASALRPVATNYAITASAKGASRALPTACRALTGRLP